MRFFVQPAGQPWLKPVLDSIRAALGDVWPAPLKLKDYVVADLPDPTKYTQGLIYVPDESGGAIPAFSDGTDWRRVTDRAVVS